MSCKNNRCELEDHDYVHDVVGHIQTSKRDRLYCDVILRSGEYEVYAHRLVLTYLSDYFSLCFKYDMGTEKSVIEFDENIITGECLEHIINFTYSGEIYISDLNVLDLFVAADYFAIEFIKEKCESYLDRKGLMLCTENLINFVWMASHFDLSRLLNRVCEFISNNFVEVSEMLCTFLSPYCMLKIMGNGNFTACDHKIPVSDVELEIYKFIAKFIAAREIPDTTIIELLGAIHFGEIQPEMISFVIESYKDMKNKEIFRRLSMPLEITSNKDRKNKSSDRIFSKKWKYMPVNHPVIDINDRISSINVYIEKVKSGEGTNRSVIVGLSTSYNSGKLLSIGKTFDKQRESYGEIFCQIFKLSNNEVVIRIKLRYGNSSCINLISFDSNFRKAFGPTLDNKSTSFGCEDFCPKSKCGYFHSFDSSSTICKLKPLWVEYTKPINKDTSAAESYRRKHQIFNPFECDYEEFEIYMEICNKFKHRTDSDDEF